MRQGKPKSIRNRNNITIEARTGTENAVNTATSKPKKGVYGFYNSPVTTKAGEHI